MPQGTVNLRGSLGASIDGQWFTMYAGESKTLQFTVNDGTTAAANLTGATAVHLVIEPSVSSTTASVSKTLASGITLTNPAAGVFTVSLVPADTASLGSGNYYFAAKVTDASGNVSVIATGSLNLLQTPSTL